MTGMDGNEAMTDDLLEWAARPEGFREEQGIPSVQIVLGDAQRMPEVEDESLHLVITSPPYWQLKDYGVETFLNAKLIREGWASYDGQGNRSSHLRRCEEEAQQERRGVWAV